MRENIQEAESIFLCTAANPRQIDKHIHCNHSKFFGNMKCLHRPLSKPQFLVIQPLDTGINDYGSAEDSPEADFVNGEPNLMCRSLSLHLLNCAVYSLSLDGHPDSPIVNVICLAYDLAHLMRVALQTRTSGHRAGTEGSYFTINTEILNSRTGAQTLTSVSRVENIRWEVLGHPPSVRDG